MNQPEPGVLSGFRSSVPRGRTKTKPHSHFPGGGSHPFASSPQGYAVAARAPPPANTGTQMPCQGSWDPFSFPREPSTLRRRVG